MVKIKNTKTKQKSKKESVSKKNKINSSVVEVRKVLPKKDNINNKKQPIQQTSKKVVKNIVTNTPILFNNVTVQDIQVEELDIKESSGGTSSNIYSSSAKTVADKKDYGGLTKEELDELEKNKRVYWNELTEIAVKEYLAIDFNFYKIRIDEHIKQCKEERKPVNQSYLDEMKAKFDESSSPEVIALKNDIYIEKIQKPLNKLVENIIYSFRLFRPNVDAKTLNDECVNAVFEKMSHFNPANNTRSFSYLGTVSKHFLQGKKKEEDKRISIHSTYESRSEEADSVETEEIDKKEHSGESANKLFNYVIQTIENDMKSGKMSSNDVQVGFTIVSILKNHDTLKSYHKNEIYQLIREGTGLPTKDITYALSRYRSFYKIIKELFIKKSEHED